MLAAPRQARTISGVATHDRDPLVGTGRLIVDGTNLLYALTRRAGPAPPAALVGRLRGAIPAPIAIELVFDGPAEPGLRGERIASGVHLRYGGGRSADAVILGLVDRAGRESGPAEASAILVVTDDRDLRHGVTRLGGRTAGAGWLLRRLDGPRLASPSAGRPRPPATAATAAPEDTVEDRSGWRPGRGATTKRGNPRRAPRTGRTGRMRP